MPENYYWWAIVYLVLTILWILRRVDQLYESIMGIHESTRFGLILIGFSVMYLAVVFLCMATGLAGI